MGTFTTSCQIANIGDRSKVTKLDKVLVDTGSGYTWVPREQLEEIGIDREKKDLAFIMANGQQITRSLGSPSSACKTRSRSTK